MSGFRILSGDNMPKIKAGILKSLLCAAAISMSMQLPAFGGTKDGNDLAADTCRFVEKIYFRKSSSKIDSTFSDNAEKLRRIADFLAGADSLEVKRITVTGSSSPEGKKAFNLRLARLRENSLWEIIAPDVERRGIDTEKAIAPLLYSTTMPYRSLRYAEFAADFFPRQQVVDTIITPAPVKNAVAEVAPEVVEAPADSMKNCEPLVEEFKAEEVQSVPVMEAKETGSKFPPVFLSTNLLYDAALTPNLGIGVYLGKKFTIFADWMHAWWSNRDRRRYWRIYGGDVELRYQLGGGKSDNPFSGHRVGVYASIVTYDFQFGRTRTGVMGDKYNYAAGVSYGYSLPLARRFSLDFSIGIGYMWGKYMKQHLIDDHDVWLSTHKHRWFGPTRAEIGLNWLIGPGNVNVKKEGGER